MKRLKHIIDYFHKLNQFSEMVSVSHITSRQP